ncbi:hypothetical protein OGAPHI_002446 [Ogataea philodendri]|uniref:cysteine--tRNA ligase n=2 Tax=Saccharomycotina TaxID=147537 RepID=A0A9P8PBA6_9ASCO|nr:uncharacterized protein OGAPHI_002446 [Ogataea philodendri]KAH3668692.1 hypothetical protein OGAPHI_002446 [Ogataea philodendri]
MKNWSQFGQRTIIACKPRFPLSRQFMTTWIQPEPQKPAQLVLYNTFTRSKVPFVPTSNEEVAWYSCGPTVYNSSHMGHARNYVTIDINRRIMQDYFGYNVRFIQNVTDIDDKIIIKARQEYLFAQYKKSHTEISAELKKNVATALQEYISKNIPEWDGSGSFVDWAKTLDLAALGVQKPKLPMHVKAAVAASNELQHGTDLESFFANIQDVLVPKLDKELGSTVTDPEIFKACSSYWERKFDEDMAALNVLPPSVTTRVSEYVPEIVEFVEKIVEKGYAYATPDGSVYFNVAKFDKDPAHEYAKLQPWSKGNMELIADGEGSLSAANGKQNASDFALWKASKAGEPSWPSPWGHGRPGWHIECSVMASDFVGSQMDIHSGGIDLAFPHHDNELAQSEAHFDCKQWVNYFLHTGHLHIEGQKMSKSLKNFITIEEALQRYSSRQLRLCFGLVQWNNSLDFKESLLNEVRSMESSLSKFFKNVRALKADNDHRLASGEVISKKYGVHEKQLAADLEQCKRNVHAAFCDNLSTPLALRSLLEQVNSANNYISSVGADLRVDVLVQSALYITRILSVVGFDVRKDGLGWEDESGAQTGSNLEEQLLPYLKVLSNFRDLVRSSAIAKADYKVFLEATDTLRDKDLLNLNVSLDDRSGQGALVKFLNETEKQELLNQQEERQQQQLEKERRRLEQLKLKEEKEKERLAKARIDPKEMFKSDEYRKVYEEWDETGLPVKLVGGEEVTKSAKKKLIKLQEQQRRLFEAYQKSQTV